MPILELVRFSFLPNLTDLPAKTCFVNFEALDDAYPDEKMLRMLVLRDAPDFHTPGVGEQMRYFPYAAILRPEVLVSPPCFVDMQLFCSQDAQYYACDREYVADTWMNLVNQLKAGEPRDASAIERLLAHIDSLNARLLEFPLAEQGRGNIAKTSVALAGIATYSRYMLHANEEPMRRHLRKEYELLTPNHRRLKMK